MIKHTARRVLAAMPPRMAQWALARYHALKSSEARRAIADVGATDVAMADINHLLHHLRGEALRKLPQGSRHFVSVGCSGTWYFEWIEQMCHPQRHTGIEFYSPRPDDLPPNVDWIANTAGNMEAVPDATADVLFSGQNIEHLWPEDIVNFLLESHRVLEDGGLLVIDSPNRDITAKLAWSHPEHIIELTVPEIEELLALAGFDIQRREGMWLCEDPATGQVLPFAELTSSGAWPLRRRVEHAASDPDHAFCWWMEARKSNRIPNADRLRERVTQIYAIAWPERLNRLQTVIGRERIRNGERWLDSEGRAGALVYGPYAPLLAGQFRLAMALVFEQRPREGSAPTVVQVSAGNEARVLARHEIAASSVIPGEPVAVSLDFEVTETTFGVQFVVVGVEGVPVLAKRSVSLAIRPA